MREQFEKLPEINKLKLMFYFDADSNMYKHKEHWYAEKANWVNGAWYAFQEQQKKINSSPNKFCEEYKEWQPDWSKAPEEAMYWKLSNWGQYMWLDKDMKHISFTPSFHYSGDWQNSLRKRPALSEGVR